MNLSYILIIISTLLLQFVLVSWSFPLAELWSDNLQFHIDAAYHWYELKFAINIFSMSNVVGYDPFFNAGYPGGVNWNVSARFPALLAVIFHPWLTAVSAYKIASFISAILGPAFVPLAAHKLKLSLYHAIIATIFGFVLWWTSIFRWYHTAGMVSYVMTSYAALWYLALVIGCLNEPDNWKQLLASGIIGATLFFVHPLFPIPIIFGTLVYWGIHYRQLRASGVIKAAIIIIILAVIPNLFWIYPVYYYHHVFVDNAVQPYQRIVNINLIWQWTLGLQYWASKITAILAFTALWACIWLQSPREYKLVWCFTFSGWMLIFFAALSGNVASGVEPNRFAPTGYLMMSIPAAMGVTCMFSLCRKYEKRWLRTISGLGLLVVVVITAYCLNEVRRELSYADIGHYGKQPPEVTALGDYSQWIINFLQRETTSSGRILFEEGRIYDNAHMAGYYAYTTNREFIGGPYPSRFFANFRDARLFNRAITDISYDDFQKYLDLYNIGWIIVHSDKSKKYMHSLPQVILIDEYKNIKAYKVDSNLDFFIDGKGIISERSHNRLLLSELEGSSVTLKYHFVQGMQSEPYATLVPVKMLDDPNPFIRIVNPPKRVLLYLP